MNEQWKNIPGFERYSVSNYGQVKNDLSGKMLSQRKSSNGYLRVNLRTGKISHEKPTVLHVHRLVAEAFVEGKQIGFQVNHIDGNKCNNYASNLEWVSASDNIKHARRTGLISQQDIQNFQRRGASAETRAKIRKKQHTEQYRKKMQKINAEHGISKRVVQLNKEGEIVATYDNCAEAARKLFNEKAGKKDILIARCARGKCKTAYGFRWKYEEDG